MVARPHVGTLREKPLHADLKHWYAEEGDLVEEPVGGYVIDLVRDGLLIEIQTRSFSSRWRGFCPATCPMSSPPPISGRRSDGPAGWRSR